MNRLLISLVALALSWSLVVEADESTILHEKFEVFCDQIRERNDDAALAMLSAKNQAEFLARNNTDNFEQHFSVLSSLPTLLRDEKGAMQKIDSSSGCLTIVGTDAAGEPVSINNEYTLEQGVWKLDYVQIIYHESGAEFPAEATCPARL